LKEIALTVTVQVPDDETDVYWNPTLKKLEGCLQETGYSLFDSYWEEIKY